MRKINKAVLKQTIQRPDGRHALRADSTKTGLCVSDEFFNEQAKKTVIELLSKYIVFQDKDHHYWIDRYWYFDVEKYEKDLNAFGIDFVKAIMEPITLPSV